MVQTKLFSDLCLVKFLDPSAKPFFLYAWSTTSSSGSGRGCKNKKLTNHSRM